MGTIKLKQTKKEAFAQAVAQNQTENTAAAEAPVTGERGVWKEFTERADSHSRHFALNNNTRKSVYSASPVSWYDEAEQKWKAIDNTLNEKADRYESSCGPCKTEIFKPAQGKKVRMTLGSGNLSWEYLGREPAEGQAAHQAAALSAAEVPETVLKVEAGKTGNLQSKESRAVYEYADPKADLEYLVQGNNLKENIIVREPAESYRFAFSMALQGLKLRLSEDNSRIEVYAEGDGQKPEKVEAFLPTPFMTDGNGVNSEEVYFEVEEAEGDTCRFVVVADADWMNAPERAFPVTIDPQIVTMDSEFIVRQRQTCTISSSCGSGTSNLNWQDNGSSSDIEAKRTSTSGTRTKLTIKKSEMQLWDYPISEVNLLLKVRTCPQSFVIYVGGKSVTASSGATLKVNITNSFKEKAGDFEIFVEPGTSEGSVTFHGSGYQGPELEVEYLVESQPVKQQFTLAGGMVGQFNVETREWTGSFTDVPGADSALGMGISHIFKMGSEDCHAGKNFRLSLNESMVKNGTGLDQQYVYTDSSGNKHGFLETYYYLDDSNAKQTVEKADVTVDPDGSLSCTVGGKIYEVRTDYRTTSGLTAVAKLEGFKNAELLEQRIDEQKQAEEQLESYAKVLESIVCCSKVDGGIIFRLEPYYGMPDSFNYFMDCVNDSCLLLSESEQQSYHSLYLQDQSNQYQYQSLKLQLDNKDPSQYTANDQNIYNQMILIGETANDLNSQRKAIQDQMCLVQAKASDYLETVRKYHKEYVNLKEQVEQMKRQLPVNYLTDGKIFKGFNEEGRLVAVYDRYNNMMTVEYDDFGKITRVYDGDSKQIVFDYRPNGLLDSITDARGRKTCYDYNADGELTEVQFADGKTLSLNQEGTTLHIESSDHEKAELNMGSTAGSLIWKSKLSSVAHGNVQTAAAWAETDKVTLSWTTAQTKISDQKGNAAYYNLDSEGKVYEYYEEQSGKVVKAEKYAKTKRAGTDLWASEKVTYAKEESLYSKGVGSFTASDFTGGDWEEVTLNEYNKPSKKETNARKLSDETTQKTVTLYEYDTDQRCVEEKTTVTIQKNGSTIKTFDQITQYSYNAAGEVTRKESWVVGEEFTNGKTVEETEFDENGNPVRSFIYNTLDPSSKFYTESEYAENGQTLADYDESGEHKTEYEYIPGTNVVRTQKLPNGSRFSYGHDQNDQVTAITQSTEEGEENSNQTVYTCGLATEHRSGNNVVRYEYDSKKRLTKVWLNEEENTAENAYLTYEYGNAPASGMTADTVEVTNAKGKTLKTYKDKQDRVIRVDRDGSLLLSYSYNEKGQVRLISDSAAAKNIEKSYDDLDRLTSYVNSIYAEHRSYDDYGKLEKVEQTGEVNRTYTYAYHDDAERSLKSVTTEGLSFCPQKDVLGRYTGRNIVNGSTEVAQEEIAYRKVGDHATNQPSGVYFGKKNGSSLAVSESIKYAYDKMGNISRIDENGMPVVWYKYDALNRLVREDNKAFGKTWLYSYDRNGNILSKCETAFTLRTNVEECTFEDVKQYEYAGDKLLRYGAEVCEYDAIGNPTRYRGNVASWENGRQMTYYSGTNFSYDGLGRRMNKQKSIDNLITFTYDSQNRLVKQSNGLEFLYDTTGVAGMIYGGNTYIYRKDPQGNIVAILDNQGKTVVKYVYDAWGNHAVLCLNRVQLENDVYTEVFTDQDGTFDVGYEVYQALGKTNPFRYRSYYFDTETELYYLKSRYYDPEVGRFITIDDISYLDPESINGLNLYAYCGNNPVMFIDETGKAPKWWQSILIGVGIIVGAAIIATAISFTGGGAAAFFIAAGKVILGGIKVAVTVGIGSGIIRAGKTVITGGTINEVGQSFVLGFADGFLAGSIYAGGSMLLSAGVYKISGLFNKGYGWSIGKLMGGYQTPQTPGISIITYKGGVNGGRSFGIDIDIFNGLHYHTNKFGIGKKSQWINDHHWMLIPIIIAIIIGLSNGWSEW